MCCSRARGYARISSGAAHRTEPAAVCLLSQRMLGSLDRRSFLESVQAAGGRFVHVRTGNARPGGHRDGPEALSAPGASASAGAMLAKMMTA